MVDIGVGCEHIPGLFIQQDIHAGGGVLLFQRVNKRGDQQHVAMMAQLNDRGSAPGSTGRGRGFQASYSVLHPRIRVPILGDQTD